MMRVTAEADSNLLYLTKLIDFGQKKNEDCPLGIICINSK